MGNILFPASSSPGEWPLEGGGRLFNAYAEPLGQGAPAGYVIKRAPGLAAFATTAQSGFRGAIALGADLYVAWSGKLVKVTAGGVSAEVGNLAGDGADLVTFARNNKTPTADYVAVSYENGASSFTDASVTSFADGDLPQPNSVAFLDGYFIFTIADGRIFASGLNAVTINGNDYTRAEAKASPLVRGITFDGDYYAFSGVHYEVYSNTGNPTGFPLSRATAKWVGLAGEFAIAGFEDGFGAKALIWVGDDATVHQLDGYGSVIISPPWVNRKIAETTDKRTLRASVYVDAGGHACWMLTGPDFTVVYDLSTRNWHERRSYLMDHCRMVGGVYAFGKWLGGDELSGALLDVREGYYREAGDPLIWEIESIASEAFPRRLAVPAAMFNFVRGTGVANGEDPIERQPQVEVAWSDDGGTYWSNPRVRPLGPQQVTKGIVRVNLTGMTGSQGRRWRLRVADPVYVGLLSADMQFEARAAA